MSFKKYTTKISLPLSHMPCKKENVSFRELSFCTLIEVITFKILSDKF